MRLLAVAGPHDGAGSGRSAGATPPRRGRLRRWMLWSALALALLLLYALLMLALLQQPVSALADIESKARTLKLVGVAFQACAVAWIGLRWRRIVAWSRLHGIVQRREHRQVLALRPKVVGLLIAYLVLVPIGPGTIYRFFAS